MKELILVKKEFRSLIKEKTLILTVLIQLLIASFSAFLVVGIMSYVSPETLSTYGLEKVNLAVISEDRGLVNLLQQEGKFNLKFYRDFSRALNSFYKHEVDGILVVSTGKDPRSDPVKIDLYLPRNDIRATLIASYLKEPLERYEENLRRERLSYLPADIRKVLEYELNIGKTGVKSSYFEFVYGILIPLLILAPAFIAGGLIIDLFTEEMEKKTLDILTSSPLSLLQVINAKIIACLAIVPVQSFLWIRLLEFNGITIEREPLILLLTISIALILIISASLLVLGYRKRGTAHFLYSLLLMNLFLAGVQFSTFSPLNLVASLSMGGSYEITPVLLFVLIPLLLYQVLIKRVSKFKSCG